MSDADVDPIGESDNGEPGRYHYLLVLAIPLLVVLGLVVMSLIPQPGGYQPKEGGLAPGELFPEIHAEGWINGSPPQPSDLKGRVVVVDLWASWCQPCREMAPEVVALHAKYKDRGVAFIGLSMEGRPAYSEMKKFLDDLQITWPNGYGADETVARLNPTGMIPRMWIVGRDGKVVWNFDSPEHPDEAIETALGRQ